MEMPHRSCIRNLSLLALTALTLALALTACGGGGSSSGSSSSTTAADTTSGVEAKGDAKVAAFGITNSTYWAASVEEIKNVVEGAGGSVEEFLSPFDPTKQFSEVQDATASGQYDAYIISALDGISIEPALKEAVAKGIKVIAISTVVGPKQDTTEVQIPGMSGAVLDPPVRRGEWLGGLATSACKGIDPCKVILEAGSLQVPTEKLFMDEATKVLDKTLGIEVASTIATELQASVAAKATAEALQANPDVNVFAADSDQSIAGTIIALKNAGISVGTGEGEVRVVGLGASEPGVTGVRDGEWFGTVLSLPADEGRLAAEAAIEAVNGELKTPLEVSASEESGIDPELTKEALPAGFKGQWPG